MNIHIERIKPRILAPYQEDSLLIYCRHDPEDIITLFCSQEKIEYFTAYKEIMLINDTEINVWQWQCKICQKHFVYWCEVIYSHSQF